MASGNLAVVETEIHYFDTVGAERYMQGILIGASSMAKGNLAVVENRLHYIGTDGNEYYIQGTPAGQATLKGRLTDDGGESCQIRFEWGPTIAYGNATSLVQDHASDMIPTRDQTYNASAVIYGLVSGITYHCRITAYQAYNPSTFGTINGLDQTFTM
mgnify:FL=1